MRFGHIVGNGVIKAHFTRMLAKGRIPQSMLFSGAEGIGKSLFAYALAAAVVDPSGGAESKILQRCHPDIHEYRPEGKLGIHTLDALRKFKEEVFLSPHESLCKVFIIYEADRMLPTSANALLKTFEEPSLDSLIILVSSRPELILPTIRSRCQKILFQKIADDEISRFLTSSFQLPEADAAYYAAEAKGSIGKAIRLMESQNDPLKAKLFELLAQGKVAGYHQIADSAASWDKEFEGLKKSLFENITQKILQNSVLENLTPIQKQAIEKEVEGLVTLKLAEEGEAILEAFLSWYRDLHLLASGSNPSYLLNKNYQSMLHEALQTGYLPPLSQLEVYLSDAKLALQRSIPFSSCFETLLLKTLLV